MNDDDDDGGGGRGGGGGQCMCLATLYICKKIGVKLNNEQWYEHTPKLVETSPEIRVKILCNQKSANWYNPP